MPKPPQAARVASRPKRPPPSHQATAAFGPRWLFFVCPGLGRTNPHAQPSRVARQTQQVPIGSEQPLRLGFKRQVEKLLVVGIPAAQPVLCGAGFGLRPGPGPAVPVRQHRVRGCPIAGPHAPGQHVLKFQAHVRRAHPVQFTGLHRGTQNPDAGIGEGPQVQHRIGVQHHPNPRGGRFGPSRLQRLRGGPRP